MKLSLFRRFSKANLISVCIVLPCLLVCFLISGDAFRRQEALELLQLSREADSAAERIGERYHAYLQSAIVLEEERNLLPSVMTLNDSRAINGIQLLKNANLFNGHTADTFLYYGYGKIYSAKGLTSTPVYFSSVLKLSDTAALEAGAVLSADCAAACALLNRGPGCSILLHFPLRNSRENAVTSANYVLNADEVANLISSSPLRDATFVRIEDEKGKTLCFSGTIGDMLQWTRETVPEPGSWETQERMLGFLNLKLVFSFRLDETYTRLRSTLTLHYLVTAFAFLLSFLVIQAITRARWLRVRRIEEGKMPDGDRMKDEIDYLSVVMNRNADESAAKIRSLRRLLREQALMMMISGLWDEQTSTETFGYAMNEEYFFLGGFRWNESATVLEEIADRSDLQLACSVRLDGNAPVLLFLAELPNSDEDGAMRKEKIGRLREKLQEHGTSSAVAVSRPYQQLSMARYAFDEVSAGLKWMNDTAGTAVIYEEIAPEKRDSLQFDRTALSSLCAALEDGDEGSAMEALDKCLNMIWEQAISQEQRKQLQEYLLQTISAVCSRKGYEENEVPDVSVKPGSIGFDEEMRNLISLVFYQRDMSGSETDQRVETAVSYLEQHYDRYDLSLDEVAHHTGVSAGYLSRLFRQKLGVGYIDYLTKLRMEKASELLLHTDLNVAEVFRRVGYIYKNSYSAKFKAYFGVNATEYRQLKQRNDGKTE